jgi:hypothetical protein
MTGQQFQLTMDAANPQALGAFWAHALGYIEEPAPEGFDRWEAALTAWGVPEEKWNDGYAIVDDSGSRPRIFFQRVPEPKTAKNRLHIDIESGARDSAKLQAANGQSATEFVNRKDWTVLRSTAADLVELGASVQLEFNDPEDGEWIVMHDPEGNEFCVC